MSIPKNILLGFVLAFIVVVAIGIYSYTYFKNSVRLGNQGAVLNEITIMAKEGKAMVADLDRNVLSFTLAGDSTFKNHFEGRAVLLLNQIEAVRKISSEYPSFMTTIDALKDTATAFVDMRKRLMFSHSSSSGYSTFAADMEGSLNGVMLLLTRLEDQASSFEKSRTETLTRHFYQFVFVFAGLLVLAVILIFGLLYTSNTTIKARELSERRLLQRKEAIKDLYENAPCGYLTVNHEGMVIACNKTLLQLLGYNKAEVIDAKHITAILPSWNQLLENHFKEVEGEVDPKEAEPELVKKNGERRVALASIAASASGLDEYMLTLVDYTERQKFRDQLIQNNLDLEAFSHSVSHDLKAPLRAVNSYSAMLKEDFGTALNDDAQHMLDTIVRNAKNMTLMIEDLLRLSRMGQKEVIESEINMESMVRNVIKGQEAEAGENKVTINVHELGSSKGDIGLIKQVWVNLISNAIKYSGMTQHPEVEIGVYKENNERVFYVKDNGSGFDMQYYDKLFGVFQRLHSRKDFEGTGVGLSIVKRIIDKHHGRVWATSEVNKGATFYFTFLGA
ncbi:ATP-binding protein [uncultured Imperialibacter sp.]|uniref:ATP-binding protein n=1 Tax=uncultured Imperialibacter sp. TaxID=1672639 RepID=UPI0030DB7AC4|tara:strand:- start:15317 stop:17002 length:1686 start_codon:yes stop_codon:yes gene_type:complete